MDKKDKDDIVTNVKRYFDHNSAKQILKEKYEAKLLFASYGGMWKANTELLMFTKLLDANEDAILIDEYGNPCKVDPVLLIALHRMTSLVGTVLYVNQE